MIKRTASATIARYASSYPAVTILGPRQAGKSTLVKAMFPSYSYANLEFTEVRELAESDTTAFFSMYPPPVILRHEPRNRGGRRLPGTEAERTEQEGERKIHSHRFAPERIVVGGVAVPRRAHGHCRSYAAIVT